MYHKKGDKKFGGANRREVTKVSEHGRTSRESRTKEIAEGAREGEKAHTRQTKETSHD